MGEFLEGVSVFGVRERFIIHIFALKKYKCTMVPPNCEILFNSTQALNRYTIEVWHIENNDMNYIATVLFLIF